MQENEPQKPADEKPTEDRPSFTKKELIDMLADTLQGIQRLPEQGLYAPVTNYDLFCFGSLVLSIFRADDL